MELHFCKKEYLVLTKYVAQAAINKIMGIVFYFKTLEYEWVFTEHNNQHLNLITDLGD